MPPQPLSGLTSGFSDASWNLPKMSWKLANDTLHSATFSKSSEATRKEVSFPVFSFASRLTIKYRKRGSEGEKSTARGKTDQKQKKVLEESFRTAVERSSLCQTATLLNVSFSPNVFFLKMISQQFDVIETMRFASFSADCGSPEQLKKTQI